MSVEEFYENLDAAARLDNTEHWIVRRQFDRNLGRQSLQKLLDRWKPIDVLQAAFKWGQTREGGPYWYRLDGLYRQVVQGNA